MTNFAIGPENIELQNLETSKSKSKTKSRSRTRSISRKTSKSHQEQQERPLQEHVQVVTPLKKASQSPSKSKSINSNPKTSQNHETEYMKTVRQTDIKLIKKPETRKRCPRRYRKHPTNKMYCFRERNKKYRTMKNSRHGTMTLKQKRPYILRLGQRRCPKGYRRNPHNKSECRWYVDWNNKSSNNNV